MREIFFNQDKETRELEEKALATNEKKFRDINGYFYGEFNSRTGDVNIYTYEHHLKTIIDSGAEIKRGAE